MKKGHANNLSPDLNSAALSVNKDRLAFFSTEEVRLFKKTKPPLSSDADYISCASLLNKIRGLAAHFGGLSVEKTAARLAGKPDGSSAESLNGIVEFLDKLYAKTFTRFKIAVFDDNNKPKALAAIFIREFSLKKFEIETLNLICAGPYDPVCGYKPFKLKYSLREAASYIGLTAQQALALVSDECPLVKKAVYEVCSEKKADALFDKYCLTPDLALLKAFYGLQLSGAEKLKLENCLPEDITGPRPGNPGPDGVQSAVTNHLQSAPPAAKETGNSAAADSNEISKDEADELLELLSESDKPARTASFGSAGNPTAEDDLKPYQNDTEYMKDCFSWLTVKSKAISNRRTDTDSYENYAGLPVSRMVSEFARTEREIKATIKKRLEITRNAAAFIPTFERYCEMYSLDETERLIFMGALYLVHENDDPRASRVLDFFCDGFDERIKMIRYLYGRSNLINSGLINVDEDYRRRSMHFELEIDRHLYNEIIGLKHEMKDIFDGSNLYRPATHFDEVVLPEDVKESVKKTVRNLSKMQSIIKKNPSGKGVEYYGTGCVMLFYGPPGTGKTMLANAIANYMNKNLLLINFSKLDTRGDRALRAIFREARLNNAIVFFDECDAILSNRYHNIEFPSIMTELERHDGFAILATNVPEELDEATRRRIMLSVEFRKPDYNMREKIWKLEIPEKIALSPDIDWRGLAFNYELTGGLIKNAVRNAILSAVERDSDSPVITLGDLETAAKTQFKNNFSTARLKNMIVPSSGIERFVAAPEIAETLRAIIKSEKNKSILFGQWGFGESESDNRGYGTTLLFHGAPGTGKTYCTEVLGYELGKPVMKVNLAHMLSCWVGETGKNIQAIFEEAHSQDAILLFDEADALFAARGQVRTATDRYANSDVNLILQEIEKYKGVAVLTTNLIDNLDPALFRRIKHTIKFDMPDSALREKLWRSLIPEQTPVSSDIDFRRIAEKYETSGAVIKKVIFTAAGFAAGRCGEGTVMITEADICRALEREYIPGAGGHRKIGFDAAA